MVGEPRRIQRKRTRGWRMPGGAVSVCRPGLFGNPFVVSEKMKPGSRIGGSVYWAVPTVEDAIECYRLMLAEPASADLVLAIKEQLLGRDLACFCQLDQPCHADVLLELANAPTPDERG